MKQTATFNQVLNKLFFLAFLTLLFGASNAYAQEVTLVSKKVQGTTATISIKVDNPPIYKDINIDLYPGDYNFLLGADTKGDPNSSGIYSESISGLLNGKVYQIRVRYSKNGVALSYHGDLGSVQTAQTPSPPPQLPTLPLDFYKVRTEAKDGTIKVAVESKSDKEFDISVSAKNSKTKALVDTKQSKAPPKETTYLYFSTGIVTGESYDLTLSGTQVGSSTKYSQVVWADVLVHGAQQNNQTNQQTQNNQTNNQQTQNNQTNNQTINQTSNNSALPTGVRSGSLCVASNQCQDCKDNNADGKADYDGNDTLGQSKSIVDPDPSCFSLTARAGKDKNGKPVQEENDDVVSDIIPCTDKCTFSDVFKLLNNLLVFFINKLLLPLFVILIMYAGYQYIVAQGNPTKKANLVKLFTNIVLGLVLILCSWLIVHTILVALGYTEGLLFFND